jgi:Ras-related protein Rab-23
VAFVFSTTDRDSFIAIERWKRKVEDVCGDIPAVLVQNKIDLLSEAKVDSYI